MIFSFDLRRARKGDCFLVHFGTAADPGLMLVDAGPADVYRPQLLPRFEAIRHARRLAPDAPLPLDLLMVSHVDDDHINGVLEMSKALVDQQKARRPLSVKVRALWHNAFDDLVGGTAAPLLQAVTARFGPASLGGEADVDGLDPVTAKVLASVGQGLDLRHDASLLHWRVNPHFDGQAVSAVKDSAALDMSRGLTFLVTGPMRPQLERLRRDYAAFLERNPRPEVLASFTDTSVPNLSSIVVLATAGGKRMLLTGDARGDKILDGLRLSGALTDDGPLHVDLLKMPHHGSDRNMTQAFLRTVTADHYVFSGDGQHGNPERETLEMLRLARGAAAYTLHFTYPLADIDAGRQAAWQILQTQDRGRGRTVRPDWSVRRQGLEAFFDAHPAMAQATRIVPASGPHVIDLLDPLGY